MKITMKNMYLLALSVMAVSACGSTGQSAILSAAQAGELIEVQVRPIELESDAVTVATLD